MTKPSEGSADRADLEVPVLIVGGGPTGLTASLTLSRMGVRSLLIERHPGTSIHPKARGVNVRTAEIFRQLGIVGTVRAAGLSAETNGFFYRGSTLLAERFERFGGGGLSSQARSFSPESWIVVAQDALEPVLLQAARSSPTADIRFGHELIELAALADGVAATVRDRTTGRLLTVRADWVVGADGSESTVRAAAGVDLLGHGPLVDNVSILFEAPLGPLIEDRLSVVYYLADDPAARPRGHPMSVGNPPPRGVLLAVDNADRWLLVLPIDGDHPGGDLAGRVRQAIGAPPANLDVRVLSTMQWSPAARVAAQYRAGRLFLAGDAAHEMTPSGAFGLNVGVADAHNLGWKLGAVVSGWASEALLDTYDSERRPVAVFAADESYRQFTGERRPAPFGNWGVILGATYESASITPDGTGPANLADPAVDYVPTARPGARAPHAWVRSGGETISTLDLYGRGFVCLAGPHWADRDERAAGPSRRRGVPMTVRRIGRDLNVDEAEEFLSLHGISASGAILVRPDGYVAWRGGGAPGLQAALDEAVRRALGRTRATAGSNVAGASEPTVPTPW